MPKPFSAALLLKLLPILLCSAISASPAAAAELPVVDMCSLKTSGYTDDLNDNGWLAALAERLAAGTVTCETQSAERLGEAGGRTYGLWMARFTDHHLGDDRTHYLAQVGEVDAAGKLSVVYRTSSADESAEIAARLVASQSSTLVVVVTPTWHFLLREPEGFKEIFMRDGVGNPTESEVKAALPEGAVTPFELDDNGHPYYRGTFNFAEMAIDLPIAMANEIFPRRFADPAYDRPLTLRFPLA